MNEQEAKEILKEYYKITGQDESAPQDNISEAPVPQVEFKRLSAHDQREFFKNYEGKVNATKQELSPEDKKAKRLEHLNQIEQSRKERFEKKQEQKEIKRQEAEQFNRQPNMQYSSSSDSGNQGLDGRKLDIIIALLEKIATNSSTGIY